MISTQICEFPDLVLYVRGILAESSPEYSSKETPLPKLLRRCTAQYAPHALNYGFSLFSGPGILFDQTDASL
jgi:hypothetical protein